MAVKLILNLSLLFTILVAPSVMIISFWYRKSLGRPVFVWHKSEMVLLTVVFFILSLLLLIVGVSCFFSYWGYLDSLKFKAIPNTQFLNLGMSCFLGIGGLSMAYLALRKLLVQMVMPKGVLLNKGFVSVPNAQNILEWTHIVDYYVVPDYPNAVFTFITSKAELTFERYSIKVPIYLKDDFQNYLDKEIYSAQTIRTSSSKLSSHNFSEN